MRLVFVGPPGAGKGTQARIVCAGGPWMPLVSVRATRNGVTRAFSGSPGCDWPGNQSLSVYYDAAMRDEMLPRKPLPKPHKATMTQEQR